MDYLNSLKLSHQQQEDLRFLAKQREWTAVLQLVDSLITMSQADTNNSDNFDKFNTNRGALNGYKKLKTIITNLYQKTEK